MAQAGIHSTQAASSAPLLWIVLRLSRTPASRHQAQPAAGELQAASSTHCSKMVSDSTILLRPGVKPSQLLARYTGTNHAQRLLHVSGIQGPDIRWPAGGDLAAQLPAQHACGQLEGTSAICENLLTAHMVCHACRGCERQLPMSAASQPSSRNASEHRAAAACDCWQGSSCMP